MNKIMVGTMSFLAGSILGGYEIAKLCEKVMKTEEKLVEKNSMNFKMANKWLRGYQQGKKINDYLEMKKISEVAIYGMGELGRRLLKELENTDIAVKYVIDRKNYGEIDSYSCYTLLDDLPNVQTIIVTPVLDFEVIAEQLRKKTKAHLLPLNQVLDESL